MSNSSEHGVALIIVMMTMTLLTALAMALTLATITETAIAVNYRDAEEVLYAAEGSVEFVMQELAGASDWRAAASGSGQSGFVDGAANGIRAVGAVSLDLAQATRDVNGIAVGAAGTPSPPFVLYAFGRFLDLVPSGMGWSDIYVAVWVADRSEPSGDEMSEPQALSVLGQAYGTRGSRRTVEAIIEKAGASTIRARAWREWR